MASLAWTTAFTRSERLRLAGFGMAVAGLHVLGWGLYLYYSRGNPTLAGLGALAYTFGLRHAFDADHIAAIDNTTRKLLQEGKRPLGVGFFFSLGHSTIVLALAAGLAIAAETATRTIPTFQHYGGYVGASVSGMFLWIIGILNLIVLIDILRIFRDMRGGSYDSERLEQRLLDRGLMNRFFLGRFLRLIKTSWQMYPLGLLFGLGFDTATEVGLLASPPASPLTRVPFLAVLSLPILFAAGMSLMDTARRRVHEPRVRLGLLQPDPQGLLQHHRDDASRSWSRLRSARSSCSRCCRPSSASPAALGWLNSLDFGRIGYGDRRRLRADWAVSVVVWKKARIEERWGGMVENG